MWLHQCGIAGPTEFATGNFMPIWRIIYFSGRITSIYLAGDTFRSFTEGQISGNTGICSGSGYGGNLLVCDFNGDKLDDLLCHDADGHIVITYNKGEGIIIFSEPQSWFSFTQ